MLPRFHEPDVGEAEQRRRGGRRRGERGRRAHPVADVELELVDHVAHRDERGTTIVAGRDPDPGRDGPLEEDDEALVERVALLDDEVRDPGADAVIDDPPVREDRGDEGRAALEHQLDRLVLAAVTVLHGVHARPERVEDADPALRMGRHRDTALVRFLDRGAHLVDRELRLAGLAATGHHAAGRHQLDRSGTGAKVLAGRPTDGIGPIGLDPHPPAVTAGHRHHATARDDPGTLDHPRLDESREVDVDAVDAADIADRRDPGTHRDREPRRASDDGLGPCLVTERGLGVRPGIETQVRVCVHQAGRQPTPGEIDHVGAVGRHVRPDRRDPPLADEDVDDPVASAAGIGRANGTEHERGAGGAGHQIRSLAQRALRVVPLPP